MSYTLTPFAVDLGQIRALLGSKNESLWKTLCEQYHEEFESIDAMGDDYDEPDDSDGAGITSFKDAMPLILEFVKDMLRGEKGSKRGKPAQIDEGETQAERAPCPTMAQALRHLIMGEACDRRVGFKYGYLLQNLSQHFGEELPHDRWYDLRHGSAWFRELDGLLRQAGVPADVLSIDKHLSGRGAPIAIPKCHDFPYIGYLTVAECERALTALNAARFDDLGEEEDDDEDAWLPGFLDDVRSWLQTCVDSRRDLVCFYA